MSQSERRTFINYDLSNPRPTQSQRRNVSAFIGRHFRNRSAPAQQAQSLPHNDDGRRLPLLPSPSAVVNGRQVVRNSQPCSSGGARCSSQQIGTGSEFSDSVGPCSNGFSPLLRPVVECLVPAYPTEHRQKIFQILDFHIHYILNLKTHWGEGPNAFARCWVQMICSDIVLFDSVAAFSHGIRITTLGDQVTPTAGMLWHKARALRGLQAKLSAENVDKVAVRASNETILATFYLMEAAARFGHSTEFKTHCLGFLHMMHLRGQVISPCLEDLYFTQAAGLVEGTEMAAKLRHGLIPNAPPIPSHESVAITSDARILSLQYLQPGLQSERVLRDTIDSLPVGFRDLAATGSLSTDFILLLEEQLQQYDNTTEAAERQMKGIRKAWLLASQSHNAVEELACLGIIAFPTRHTAQMQLFPELSLLKGVKLLGQQVRFFGLAGPFCFLELRAWVILAGAEIATTAGAALKQHAYDMMTELLFEERWIDSWRSIERAVKGYLWNEKTTVAWKRYWTSYQDVNRS
ncbi:hypothetical protein PMG11_10454 [Penicillium brasilianum]|uniref:Uncharacterized protein n=1 Tax=Penicillium brasilianum TaxID=104259 RepID=A0A0F7TZC7_PENBI|nr:hypothetical protein PMG11_10454 [Penicillium brasilianum]